MGYDATATLTAAGWTRKRDYFTHADSPDSKIFVTGRNWKHTAWGGVEQLSAGIFASRNVTVGTGRSLRALRKHLGYWKRTLNMASGS
jgi:hypothetical protein